MNNQETTRNKPSRKPGTPPPPTTDAVAEYVFGKVRPQAVPLEEAVLGGILLDKNALALVMDILRPDVFYLERHQVIYRAIVQLYESSSPIDLLTVTEALRRSQELERAGGAFYLVELTNRVASAANIEYHARIIAQKYIMREVVQLGGELLKDGYEDTMDCFELLNRAEQDLFAITQKTTSKSVTHLATAGHDFLRYLEQVSKVATGLTGVPSGLTDLDRLTAGWQPSDLIIIAARPGMGKSALITSIALNAARDFQKPVALFTLEMPTAQVVARILAQMIEVPLSRLRKGQLDDREWQQVQSAVEQLSQIPIYIDDTAGLNIYELRAKCRRLKKQHDIELVIVDYLQLMSAAPDAAKDKGGNREQEISTISRALKALAKELNVPVIALSQLSRAVETRGGSKRPMLSDLRESGAIEQDADMVGFIYRPEYYQILEDERGNSLKGTAEFIIAKHRNGALDTAKLKFIDTVAKFADLDDPVFAVTSTTTDRPALPCVTLPAGVQRMNEDDIPF